MNNTSFWFVQIGSHRLWMRSQFVAESLGFLAERVGRVLCIISGKGYKVQVIAPKPRSRSTPTRWRPARCYRV